MPDQTVKVTFTAPSTFVFDPPSVSMTAAGKIVMHRHPETATWTFVSVNELPSPEYSYTLVGNGSSADVHDSFTTNGSSHYTVTVNDASGNHTSGESAFTVDDASGNRTSADSALSATLPMIVNQ